MWWAVYDLDGGEDKWAGIMPLFVDGPTAAIALIVMPETHWIPVRTVYPDDL